MTDVCYFLLTFHLDCMITLSITSVKCCIHKTDTRLWLADCDLAYGATTMRLGELRNLRLERDSAVLETSRVAETKLTVHCNQRHAAIHWSLVSTVLWLGCQSFCHMIKSSHGQFVSQLVTITRSTRHTLHISVMMSAMALQNNNNSVYWYANATGWAKKVGPQTHDHNSVKF